MLRKGKEFFCVVWECLALTHFQHLVVKIQGMGTRISLLGAVRSLSTLGGLFSSRCVDGKEKKENGPHTTIKTSFYPLNRDT